MTKEEIERMCELEKRATKGPFVASPHGADSPHLYGPGGQSNHDLLASFFWKCHPNTPEAIAKEEDETYALIEFVAALRNAAPQLLATALSHAAMADRCKALQADLAVATSRWEECAQCLHNIAPTVHTLHDLTQAQAAKEEAAALKEPANEVP